MWKAGVEYQKIIEYLWFGAETSILVIPSPSTFPAIVYVSVEKVNILEILGENNEKWEINLRANKPIQILNPIHMNRGKGNRVHRKVRIMTPSLAWSTLECTASAALTGTFYRDEKMRYFIQSERNREGQFFTIAKLKVKQLISY